MNLRPDPDHLASAYLDGELSADERALVEASPDLMRVVEAMMAVRTALRHVPVEPHHRSGAVQAALAEYDRGLAPSGSPVEPHTPVSLDQRRRLRLQSRVLAVAAGLLLVGVVGVSVLRSDDTSSGSSGAAESRAAADATAEAVAASDPVTQGVTATDATETKVADTIPGSTIGAINSPATAAVVVVDAAGLLALPDADTGTELSTGCALEANEVAIARIIWVDTTAWAIRATDTGAMRVLDLSCTTLTAVTP